MWKGGSDEDSWILYATYRVPNTSNEDFEKKNTSNEEEYAVIFFRPD